MGSKNLPSFGDLLPDQNDYATAHSVIVPIPYDATTSYKTGTREGPMAILAASHELELFDEQLLYSPADLGICTLDGPNLNLSSPKAMVQTISDYCQPICQQGKFAVALGGDHSITIGCVQAWSEHTPDLSVLIIDAHADLRDSYQNTPYSHACVSRRLIEKHPITQVGVRSFSKEEYDFMTAHGLHPWSVERIRQDAHWTTQVSDKLSKNIYLSIDLDGFDPAICPGVGTPEPGGLQWHEVLGLIAEISQTHHIVAADVVECLPLAGQHHSEFLAARLVYKLIAHRFFNRGS